MTSHRLHVVSLPHTQVTRAFTTCAYTDKVRKFCNMMTEAGNEVVLYAGEDAECKYAEHVVCFREGERRAAVSGLSHFTQASFDSSAPHWREFNNRVAFEVRKRAKERDFLCLIAGAAHKPICDYLPELRPLEHNAVVPAVEWGVGYGGVFSRFRVWESYAWMHHILGWMTAKGGGTEHGCDGKWFDAVIPNYVDPADFPREPMQEPKDYILYVGRLIDRKGIVVARDVAAACGRTLVLAGPGQVPDWAREHYAGELDPGRRAKHMRQAHCLIAPTIYVEPFGTVAIEAMAAGCPVVATDWGGFTETVRPGETGYLCRTLQQFVDGVEACGRLDRRHIRDYALGRYSTNVVKKAYQDYFDTLSTLWGKGWSQLRDARHDSSNLQLLSGAGN